VFTSMRAVEHVRNAICYTKLNVKIASTHSGIETGPDGATHQAIEDIAIIHSIPNIKLLVPATPNASRKLTTAAAQTDGPVYLRFGKEPAQEFYPDDEEFPIGGSKQLRDGSAAAIIACGGMLAVALTSSRNAARECASSICIPSSRSTRMQSFGRRRKRAASSPSRTTASSAAWAARSARSPLPADRPGCCAWGCGTYSAIPAISKGCARCTGSRRRN